METMLYELVGMYKGNEDTLIISTKDENKLFNAKLWALERGFTNIVLIKNRL